MATYKDFNGILKEPVEVDANPQKRWTPQRVRFINNGNEFYGRFFGSVVANEGLSANRCTLSDVNLYDCKFYTKNGDRIDLDDIISSCVTYRGILSLDFESEGTIEHIENFSTLFQKNNVKSPIFNRSMYMTKGSFQYIEGLRIGNNDILIANKQIDVISEMSKNDFDIINSQDSDVVHFDDLSGALLDYVTLSTDQEIIGNKKFGKISADDATIKFLKVEDGIEISSVSLDVISATNGYIDTLSVNDFRIDDEKISQTKIIGLTSNINVLSDSIFGKNQLSDKVQFLLSVGHDSMEYKNPLSSLDTTFSVPLFLRHNGFKDDDIIKRGFMYRMSGSQSISSEGSETILKICDNDYLIFNKDVFVKNASLSDIDIIFDASFEGKEISVALAELRDYVYGLSSDTTLTSDDNSVSIITNVNQTSGLVSVSAKRLVSSDVYGLSDWVKSRIEDLNVNVISAENGWFIDSVWQEKGKLSATKRQIVSSDIGNLSDYVHNEINLSIQNLTSEIVSNDYLIKSISQKNGTLSAEYTKVTNDYIEDNSIYQGKISGLVEDLFNISSDLSTVIRRNKGDVSLMGDFTVSKHDGSTKIETFKHLLLHNIRNDEGYEVKKGFMYNINFTDDTYLEISDSVGNKVCYENNDFIIFKDNVVISSANISDIYRIKDYDSEISDLVAYVDTRIKNLSVEDISAGNGYIIYSIFENDGIVSARTRELLSSDVNYLEEYVQNEVSLSIDSLQSELLSDNYLIKSITQTKGILTAEYTKVGNNLIEDESISQNKITTLTTDLSNISSDLSSIIHKVNTISNDTEIPTGYIISSLKQNEGRIEFGSSQILSSYVVGLSDFVDYSIGKLDVGEISSLGNQVIEKIWQTDGKISATTRTLMSSDVSGLPEYVGSNFEQLCSMAFILSNENHVLCSNVYDGLQEFSNLCSEEITVPYAKLKDLSTKTLSDFIEIEPYFESLYSGIAETVSYVNVYRKKKIEFNVDYTIISAYETINTLGDELCVEISPRLSEESQVIDGFNALQKIIDNSDVVISRNLEDELKQINIRFDSLEKAVANHTKHCERTFERDVDVAVTGKTIQFDMLKMVDEANEAKQYTMHLSGGTIVLIPSK